MTTMNLAWTDVRDALPRKHHLFRVGPHNGAHRVALRAGVSIALPLLVLWLTGHLSWAPYAAFGAFTSLYGRAEAHPARLRMQLATGLALTLAVTAGAAVACSPDRRWLAVAVVAACATAGSLVGDRLRWHPQGPIFIVFGSAAVSVVPAAPARIPVAFAVAASAALAATAIGTAGRFRASVRRAPVRRASAAASDTRPGWQWAQALRFGTAVLLAGGAATAIGIGHPYWSMVSAVVAVTGPDTTARLTRAAHRVTGTLFGVLLAAAILAAHLPVLALIATIGMLQCATELLVGRNYALATLFLTPLALTMGTLAQPVSEWTLLHDRTIETLLGTAIGIAISVAAHRRGHAPGVSGGPRAGA